MESGTVQGSSSLLSIRADSNYAKNPDDHKSISGCCITLDGALVIWQSSTQPMVSLSITEAEQCSGVQGAQNMLYSMHWLEVPELQVEKPMILEMDNKGAIDLANNWSTGGQTRHVEVGQYFLRNSKSKGWLLSSGSSPRTMRQICSQRI